MINRTIQRRESIPRMNFVSEEQVRFCVCENFKVYLDAEESGLRDTCLFQCVLFNYSKCRWRGAERWVRRLYNSRPLLYLLTSFLDGWDKTRCLVVCSLGAVIDVTCWRVASVVEHCHCAGTTVSGHHYSAPGNWFLTCLTPAKHSAADEYGGLAIVKLQLWPRWQLKWSNS